jgi:hypothetical protein
MQHDSGLELMSTAGSGDRSRFDRAVLSVEFGPALRSYITQSFVLLLSMNSAGRNARITWRRGNQVGIQFL